MSVVTALQFTNGNGIYLTLKRGSNKDNDRLIPKYFDVSWLSQYPNENERLFYGENVFAIHDIYEAQKQLSHSEELHMLNIFQKCVRNKDVNWTSTKKEKKMIEALTYVIDKCQHENIHNVEEEYEEKKYMDTSDSDLKQMPYVSEYCLNLFKYFCQNKTAKWICIKRYDQLPKQLKQ
eukprot:236604_1